MAEEAAAAAAEEEEATARAVAAARLGGGVRAPGLAVAGEGGKCSVGREVA